MQVIAVSPESDYANEASVILRLLAAGLARYHLRKPGWTAVQCAEVLERVPTDLHPRLSIHQCYELAQDYAVSIHLKEDGSAHPAARSRSLHRLESIHTDAAGLDYVFLSPVFPSISKPGYAPAWSEPELRTALAKPAAVQVYALGGITAANADRALDFGFDGLILHGALWQAADPLQAFNTFREVAA